MTRRSHRTRIEQATPAGAGTVRRRRRPVAAERGALVLAGLGSALLAGLAWAGYRPGLAPALLVAVALTAVALTAVGAWRWVRRAPARGARRRGGRATGSVTGRTDPAPSRDGERTARNTDARGCPEAVLLLRAMVAAALAADALDERAKVRIWRQGRKAGLDESLLRAALRIELARPWPIERLAAACRDRPQRARVYAAACFALQDDNAAARDYLQSLIDGLGLSPETVATVHRVLGR